MTIATTTVFNSFFFSGEILAPDSHSLNFFLFLIILKLYFDSCELSALPDLALALDASVFS
jgi:hypothetical protein